MLFFFLWRAGGIIVASDGKEQLQLSGNCLCLIGSRRKTEQQGESEDKIIHDRGQSQVFCSHRLCIASSAMVECQLDNGRVTQLTDLTMFEINLTKFA